MTFRPNLIFRAFLFIACTLAVTLAGCSDKPPSENDARMAIQHYLLGQYGGTGPGFFKSLNMANDSCASQLDSGPICVTGSEFRVLEGRVKEVAGVTEIGPSKGESALTQGSNRYGVPFWRTRDITVWPVKVQLILECICHDGRARVAGVPTRTVTTTEEYKLRYDANSKDQWSVRH